MFKNTITEYILGFDIVCSIKVLWYGQEMWGELAALLIKECCRDNLCAENISFKPTMEEAEAYI